MNMAIKRHKARVRKDDAAKRRLAELDEMERRIWDAYEKGDITDEELEFEMDGISVSRSIIIKRPY